MGKLKEEAAANVNEDVQQHKLTDVEANYLRLLNIVLQYDTRSGKIMSGYLYQIAVNRLGYKTGVNLQFEFNFDDPANMLIIKIVPASELEKTPTPPAHEAGETGTPPVS